MNRILHLTVLLFLSFFISNAQTTWTGFGANDNWNNIDNWSTFLVPTASDNVIIPTGFTVNINVAANVLSLQVQGNSTLNISTNLTFTEASSFAAGTTINWNSGYVTGASTSLTNNGTVNVFVNNVFLAGLTTFINNGQINFTSTGDIYIAVDAELNNTTTGTISFLANGGNFSESGNGNNLLTNDGLIVVDLPDANHQVFIYTEFQNNNGTIQVNNGILNLSHNILEAQVLTDGTYNVASTGTLDFDSAITLTGSLSGTLDGTMNWRGNANVASGDTASFDFTGNAIVDWVSGALVGGGTLTNNSTINIIINNVFIYDASVLINNSDLRFTGTGDIYIGVDGVVNNTTTGTISFLANGGNFSESGNGANLLTNDGLIVVDLPGANDQVYIYTEFQNNNGTIQVNNGILNLSHNILEAQVLTDGTYNVASTGTLDFDSAITLTGSLSGTLDGTLNWRGNANVASGDTASFDFTGNAIVDWVSGALVGGGTLTNNSTINIIINNVFIYDASVLINNSDLRFTGTGDIYIGVDGVVNNTTTGTISFLANGGNFSESGNGNNLLTNDGLIVVDLPDANGQVYIYTEFQNNDGTIQVNNGILNLSHNILEAQVLTNGTYNVASTGTLDFDSAITLTGSLSGTLDGTLNWRGNTNVVSGDTASFDFTGNAIVDWVSGALAGGGTLTNNSTINIIINNVFIYDASALINNSDIRFTNTGGIYIGVDGLVNNTTTGTISFLANAGNFTESGNGNNLLTNDGLILVDLPGASDQVYISTEFQNNDGTIQVNNGILNLSHSILEAQVLTDGTYNVASTGTLDFDSAITLTGSLSGTLDGTLNWRGNANVASGDTASFDFTGNAIVDWVSGTLVGGGTLINNSTIDVLVGNVFIQEISLLTNNSLIQFTGTGNIYIGEDSELRNSTTGLIDFQANGSGISPSGNGINLFNNQGLVKNTSGGNVTISAETENSGTIEATSGVMSISTSLDNQIGGTLSGVGTINLPSANLTNDGNVSPGLSPGTLTLGGNYLSTGNSVLEMELNGLIPDTEHDVLAITGTNVIFEGTVDVTLGFQPSIGDSFTIATVSGTIATGNLVSPIYAEYACMQYTFEVSYPNSDSVLLSVTAEEDVHDPIVVTQNITVQLDASGSASITTGDVDFGSSDNCAIDFMSLDVSTFTCADVGTNTVTLTVTDVNGNSANTTATVTVEDMIAPTVATQNVTVQLDASGNASITTGDVDFGSSDNCAIDFMSLDVSTFTCADLGDNTVTLTVTDVNGNSASTTAVVAVEDNIQPEITCPADYTEEVFDDELFEVPNYVVDNTVVVSDNCDSNPATIQTPVPGTMLTDGVHTISVQVTDASGNIRSCSFELTITRTLSVNDSLLLDSQVVLYPNPVGSRLTIKNVGNLPLTQATIIDVNGRVVQTINLSDSVLYKEVLVSNLLSGVYFVKVDSEMGSITKRIVKQ